MAELLLHIEDQQRLRLVEEEARTWIATALSAYGIPLSLISSFKYLGRFLSAVDDYWPVVVRNLIWVQKKWARLMLVLVRKGADAWTLGILYVKFVQVVLLYGSET